MILLLPQFVPFRDYMDRTGNHVLSMARLAKDVLAEIPDQFISYMKSRGIKPNPAPPPYTPPGHTHHHTQIWDPSSWLFHRELTACSSHSRVPWELSSCCFFCGANRSWRTRKWVLGCCCFFFLPAPSRWLLERFVCFFFVSLCFNLFGRFLLKRGCKLFRKKSLLLDIWAVTVWHLMRQQVGSKGSRCGLKLVPVCGCFL